MTYYFFAVLFVFLDFNIPLAYGGTLGALPDFLGYALFLLASIKLGHENEHFRRLRILSIVMLPLSVAEFVLELTPLVLPLVVALVVSVVMTVLSLYLTYEFSEGAKALERSLYKKLEADKIATAWLILSMTSLLRYLGYYLPSIVLPCEVVHLLAVVWFSSAVFHFERKLRGKEK